MLRHNRWWSMAALLLLAGALGACGQSQTRSTEQAASQTTTETAPAGDVRITTIDLGNAIQADKRVTMATTTFNPGETVYASVATDGAAANATLTARWTYQDGQVVHESTQTIAPTGPEVTEFHVSKPDGWPAGKYNVEILLNGTSVGKREFEVKTS
jgi:hypothetical protein